MAFFASAIQTLQTLVVRWALAWVCGALSICWRATARTIPAPMLMYGKEASNRKQEIDRQHTLFRTKDQKKSIVEMCITGYSVMDNSIHSTWKS